MRVERHERISVRPLLGAQIIFQSITRSDTEQAHSCKQWANHCSTCNCFIGLTIEPTKHELFHTAELYGVINVSRFCVESEVCGFAGPSNERLWGIWSFATSIHCPGF